MYLPHIKRYQSAFWLNRSWGRCSLATNATSPTALISPSSQL
jgi:hypothetical protein